jgi:hypothetical protein
MPRRSDSPAGAPRPGPSLAGPAGGERSDLRAERIRGCRLPAAPSTSTGAARAGRSGRGPVVRPGAATAAARRARLVARRRRLGAVVLCLGVVVATLLGGGSSVASRPGAPRAVVVREGTTLWDIAARYAPPDMDLRAYVDALVALNQLGEPPEAGQRVRLPG